MSVITRMSVVMMTLALGVGTAKAQGTHLDCKASQNLCLRVAAYVSTNISPWLSDPAVVNAVEAQDKAHAGITNVQIDKDDIGFSKRTNKKLIDEKMNNPLSTFLRKKKEVGNGTIFEIFVYDDKGLNVGQTNLTQDYLQGDEAKYWKSYGNGPGAIFVDKVGKDHGKNISQASLTITNPASGKAIGAVTVGIDVDKLK